MASSNLNQSVTRFLKVSISSAVGSAFEDFIISSYKNISWPNFVLPLDVYLPRLREKISKERESKLNKLLKI
jgi:hypothetical protein